MLRTNVLILALSIIAPFATAQESRPADPAVTVPTFNNTNCPVMGKPVSTKFFVETTFGRIYMCCKGCAKKIEKDPEGTYKAAYPTTKKVGNKTCPVTGEALDAKPATVTIQGYEIGLCCAGCATGVVENGLVVLAKLTNPKVVDIGNTTCPITGKPVQNNTFCLIGDDLVHLSSTDCVETVMKDPKKALDKAKEIKAGGKNDAGEKKPHDGCCGGASEKKPGGGCCGGGEKKSAPQDGCCGSGAAR